MFLLDTNVWLEILLDQEKAGEVRRFLENTDADQIAISEFSLYSIGIILTRLNRDAVFHDFLTDTIEDSGVTTVRLDPAALREIISLRTRYPLDFDDAYQYLVAARHGYTLVSYDSDFDETDLGRRSPSQAVAQNT